MSIAIKKDGQALPVSNSGIIKWDNVENKPFSALDTNELEVTGDALGIKDEIVKGSAIANNSISDEYSSTKAYVKGDYCIYNNKLWVCIADATGRTPSSSSTYWQETKISSELSSVNDKLSSYTDEKVYNIGTTATTIPLPDSYRGFFIVTDSNTDRQGMYIVSANTSGGLRITTVKEAGDLSIDVSEANKLKLKTSSGSRYVFFKDVNLKSQT